MNLNELKAEIVAESVKQLFASGADKSAMAQAVTEECPLVGKFCIVRTMGAGVHAGVVQAVSGSIVTMAAGSLRLWLWHSNLTTGALHGVAETGLDMGKSRVEQSPRVVVLLQAVELIEVAPDAIGKISEGWAK